MFHGVALLRYLVLEVTVFVLCNRFVCFASFGLQLSPSHVVNLFFEEVAEIPKHGNGLDCNNSSMRALGIPKSDPQGYGILSGFPSDPETGPC